MKKQTTFIGIIGYVLLIALAFIGCPTPNDNNSGDENVELAKIDITNATNLFIAPASNNKSIVKAENNTTTKLLKITSEGYIQEVSYIDKNGNKITSIQTPSAIYNVNNDYVIFVFDNKGYLTRKSDGAVFALPPDSIPYYKPQEANFKNAKKIQTDNDDNIYYQAMIDRSTGDVGVVKLNIVNPNAIIKTDYLPFGDTTNSFAISPDGHIVYKTYPTSRIKKSNGGLYNLPIDPICFYIGLDGKIKGMTSQTTITTYNIDSGYNVSTNDNNLPFYTGGGNGAYLLYFENKILVVGSSNAQEIESDSPHEIVLPIKNTKKVAQSNSYYYISGNDSNNQPVLLKITPLTDNIQYIFAPNLYDIYDFTVSDNDVITFTALRMSDGAKVIGNVSAIGETVILSTTLGAESIVLERIK
jgi:hypothetical protein